MMMMTRFGTNNSVDLLPQAGRRRVRETQFDQSRRHPSLLISGQPLQRRLELAEVEPAFDGRHTQRFRSCRYVSSFELDATAYSSSRREPSFQPYSTFRIVLQIPGTGRAARELDDGPPEHAIRIREASRCDTSEAPVTTLCARDPMIWRRQIDTVMR